MAIFLSSSGKTGLTKHFISVVFCESARDSFEKKGFARNCHFQGTADLGYLEAIKCHFEGKN